MSNFPLLGMEARPGKSKAEDISEPSMTPGQVVVESKNVSEPSSKDTSPPVATNPPLPETSKNLDFSTLRLQASLLAGSIGEWKVVEGARVKSETVYLTQPNGKIHKAIRIFLAVDGNDLEVVDSADGIDFAVNGERMKIVESSGK